MYDCHGIHDVCEWFYFLIHTLDDIIKKYSIYPIPHKLTLGVKWLDDELVTVLYVNNKHHHVFEKCFAMKISKLPYSPD